jgi:Kef-type K+ transport system membrane component KefB
MTPLLSFIILLIIAYLGSVVYRKIKVESIWLKGFTYSGSIYLIIGFLIGPNLLGLLTEDIIRQLNVLVGFVLGWTGFLIGLQAKKTELKRYPKSYFLFSSLNFLIVFCSVFIILTFLVFINLFNLKTIHIAVVSIITAVSSPILIGILKHDFKLRGQFIHLLQFSVGFDNILAIVAFGFSLMIFDNDLNYILTEFIFVFITILLIFIIAWIFYSLTKQIENIRQFFLILIGSLIVIVGIALNLNISILFSSFIFGMVITNLPVNTRKLYQSIINVEKPLYYLMLIFIGSSIKDLRLTFLVLLSIFLLSRYLLKYIAGYIARLPIMQEERPVSTIGLTYIGIGGVGLALALDFYLVNITDISIAILILVSGTLLINDIFALKLQEFVIKK